MAVFKQLRVRYPYDENDVSQLDILFSGVFRREVLSDQQLEQERVDNASALASQFMSNVFQDEYSILYELAVTRRLTTGDWSLLEAVIEENREIILSAPQVKLTQYTNLLIDNNEYTESDCYDAFKMVTKAAYERICNMKFAGAEGFRTACNSFVEVFERKYTRQCLNLAASILTAADPYVDYREGRRREYQGYVGAMDFLIFEKAKIDALRRTQISRQYVLDTEWLHKELDPKYKEEQEKRRELLCELKISEIDDTWSGLRRSHFVGIMGPPKGGKTTMCAFMVHRLLQAGRRVTIWAMEGSAREQWINKLIAVRCRENGRTITTSDIQRGLAVLSPEDMAYVDNIKATLISGERLSFIEETGYVEDFLEIIDGHYRGFNRFDAIVIDSLLNLQSKYGRKKYEYLSSAYITLKNWVEHKYDIPPVCIVTAQFKQEAIKEARNSADISFDETSGGETAETTRTPDEVLGIFGTPEQKEIGRTTLHHIATRHSSQFKKFEVRANFGAAFFESVR